MECFGSFSFQNESAALFFPLDLISPFLLSSELEEGYLATSFLFAEAPSTEGRDFVPKMDTSDWREKVEQVLAAVGLAWCTPPPSPIKMEVTSEAEAQVRTFE